MTADAPGTLRIVCRAHGVIRVATIFCTHDAEDVTRTTANAHSATYGADCESILDIAMVDTNGQPLETGNHTWHPGMYPTTKEN